MNHEGKRAAIRWTAGTELLCDLPRLVTRPHRNNLQEVAGGSALTMPACDANHWQSKGEFR